MSFTLYILPSQIETFTLKSSVDGIITNESSVASKSRTWRVELTQGKGETITLSAPGFKTKTVTLPTEYNSENAVLTPKALYAWQWNGLHIYTATPNPTPSTLCYTDFYDENGDNYCITHDNLNGYFPGDIENTIESADSSQITLMCYYEK